MFFFKKKINELAFKSTKFFTHGPLIIIKLIRNN